VVAGALPVEVADRFDDAHADLVQLEVGPLRFCPHLVEPIRCALDHTLGAFVIAFRHDLHHAQQVLEVCPDRHVGNDELLLLLAEENASSASCAGRAPDADVLCAFIMVHVVKAAFAVVAVAGEVGVGRPAHHSKLVLVTPPFTPTPGHS
jgi:hypothetical protein